VKLRALFSNNPERFPRIEFRDGLSVVFARVLDPSTRDRDSHNLGKTFLVRVLDYALLATCNKEHPFKTHPELFEDFVFFLELEAIDGSTVVIRRPVEGRKSISINVSTPSDQDCSSLPIEDWTHPELGLGKARKTLDSLLGLTAIEPYGFRKGLGYFLRRQNDYENEFMISRFGRGKDRDWKPFMALLLGLDHDLAAQKYELDAREERIRAELKDVEAPGAEYDELRGVVDIRTSEVRDLRTQVETFDFVEIETAITTTTVRSIESQIADLNEHRYEIELEEAEIQRALATEFGFDLGAIREVFEEAQLALPDRLVKDYEELVDFNQRLSSGRKARLRDRLLRLGEDRRTTQRSLEQLNEKRRSALAVITQRETLEKFRGLERRLLGEEEELLRLNQELSRLDRAGELEKQLRSLEQERLQLVDRIEAMVRAGSSRYTSVREQFARLVRSILFAPAVLSTAVNQAGNLEFRTRIVESGEATRETAEGEGTSYRKILCACFDLALLTGHAGSRFYRFVYHDGIFEGLDNRRKVSLLSTVREICSEFGLQYILTVIDADLPRDEADNKLLFNETEIVRELDESGDQGRLFRMPSF